MSGNETGSSEDGVATLFDRLSKQSNVHPILERSAKKCHMNRHVTSRRSTYINIVLYSLSLENGYLFVCNVIFLSYTVKYLVSTV